MTSPAAGRGVGPGAQAILRHSSVTVMMLHIEPGNEVLKVIINNNWKKLFPSHQIASH